MTKYKEYYQKMLSDNKELFESFRGIHDGYAKGSLFQEDFNEKGKPIISIIRDYEDRLCRHSEGSGYASYAGNLAEKFWGEVRKDFPLIDRVGATFKEFELKKINLI